MAVLDTVKSVFTKNLRQSGIYIAFVPKILAVAVVAMAFAWQLAHYKGLPIVLVVLAVLLLVYVAVTKRSVFGRHVYAIGGNLSAATLSGIKVKWVSFW